MAGRNMRSSSASTSFPSNFSSAGGRIFASQKWENEIPLKFQREIRQVAVEQPIMPDGRDPGYRSNEQRPDFPWRGTEPFQGNDEALSSYARRADGATGWQSGVGRGRGGRWNGNFVAESGYRASGERLAREQHTGNRAVSGALVENNRGAPVRIEDDWGKEYSPRGRDGHRASGNAYIQQVASSPSGYSSPRSGGFNKSYQRRTADEQVSTRGVRSWKKEERGVAASQETKTRVAHQSKWQKEKLLDSLNESETVGHEQVGMIRTGTNCDPREQTTVPAAITSYEEVPCNTSSNFATGDHIQVLPMIVYRRSMIESNFEEASLPSIIGTCQDMCPAAEREMRQRLRDLAVFERLNGNQGKTSRELAVKKFCRNFSIKDLQQQDVRPFSVLSQTMNYLLRFLDDCDYSYVAVYDFLFDRTRAIRQELGMQRIIHKHAVTIYENLVRFHILSEHILHGESSFNSHLNLEQLSKALISLLNLHCINTKDYGHKEFPHEAEFHCYYVLMNLGNHSGIQVEKLSSWFCSIKPALLKTSEMQFARNVLRCYQAGNFRKFFKLVEEATFLQACLMELYFDEVRLLALSAINHSGYKLHPFPLQELAKLLLLQENDLEEFCKMHGLLVERDSSSSRFLQHKQAEFISMKKGKTWYCCSTIDKKCASSFLQEVLGRT